MSNFSIGKHYDESFIGMDSKEVQQNLESVAYGTQEKSYTKNLTEEELIERKERYAANGIKLSEIAEEKKLAAEQFKLREKEPKAEASLLLDSIKFKSEQIYGKVFLVDDQETKTMYIFDQSGMCVEARSLDKEERQLKLKTVNSDE